MFESILEKVLIKNLGWLFSNIDSKNLSIGVWSGIVKLNNLTVRQDIFKSLGLPFIVLKGIVIKLEMSVPWRSLGSQAVEINLEGFNLIMIPIESDEFEFSEQ